MYSIVKAKAFPVPHPSNRPPHLIQSHFPFFRSRSSERDRHKPSSSKSRKGGGQRPVVSAADLEGKSPDEQEMMKAMGFCGFDTTKNKKVDGNDAGEVHVILKRKYRQYMNRKGGFNRPLDFVA